MRAVSVLAKAHVAINSVLLGWSRGPSLERLADLPNNGVDDFPDPTERAVAVVSSVVAWVSFHSLVTHLLPKSEKVICPLGRKCASTWLSNHAR